MIRRQQEKRVGRSFWVGVLRNLVAVSFLFLPQALILPDSSVAQQVSATDAAKLRQLVRDRDILFRSGKFQEAYQNAVDILRLVQALGAEDILVADNQVRLAMIAEKLEKFEEAASLYAVACPVFVAKASRRDTRPVVCQHSWAMVLLSLGRADDARPIYESALDGMTRGFPVAQVGAATYALAERLKEKHLDEEATKYFNQAADIYSTTLPKQVDFAVASLQNVVELLAERRHPKETASVIRRILDLLSEASPPNPARVATWKFELADTLIATGEFDGALALLQEVKRSLASASRSTHAGPEVVLSRIAGLQIRLGASDAGSSSVSAC
jgi:tetratricopeptide (TPR) repeat protein